VNREHDISYSHINNFTDRHAPNKVLADKTLERVTARDSILRESSQLPSGQRWKPRSAGHETEEEDEEKGNKKADTSNSETRRCVIVSANVGYAPWSAERPASAKAINDSKAARHQLEELQRHDRSMEQGRGLYLAPYKYRQGNCKEKKKTLKRR